jgi:hypothetical protein
MWLATTQSSTIEFRSIRREDYTLLGWWASNIQSRLNQLLDRTPWVVDIHWRIRRP